MHNACILDPEIDRVNRSSRSFDVGVELSQKSQRKLSWSIESVVRLWSRASRFSAVKSTFLTGWPSFTGVATDPWARAHPTSARVGSKICTNSKSFLRSRGGGSRLRIRCTVRVSYMNKSQKCVCPLQIVYAYLASGGSAPRPRWGTSVPRSTVPNLLSNPGYANASLWRKMAIRHQFTYLKFK